MRAFALTNPTLATFLFERLNCQVMFVNSIDQRSITVNHRKVTKLENQTANPNDSTEKAPKASDGNLYNLKNAKAIVQLIIPIAMPIVQIILNPNSFLLILLLLMTLSSRSMGAHAEEFQQEEAMDTTLSLNAPLSAGPIGATGMQAGQVGNAG